MASAPQKPRPCHRQLRNYCDVRPWALYIQSSRYESEKWISFIGKYSERELTYHSDKLIAVSAIARDLQSRLNSMYFVNVWGRNLPLELCWMLIGNRHLARSLQKPYRATLRHSPKHPFNIRYIFFRPTALGRRGSQEVPMRQLADTVDILIQGPDNDPFGQIQSETVVPRGNPLSAFITECSDDVRENLADRCLDSAG
jgi:hypothetical protein